MNSDKLIQFYKHFHNQDREHFRHFKHHLVPLHYRPCSLTPANKGVCWSYSFVLTRRLYKWIHIVESVFWVLLPLNTIHLKLILATVQSVIPYRLSDWLLNSTPWNDFLQISLFCFHQLMDIWVISSYWSFWIKF